jgi:hypothetical protein
MAHLDAHLYLDTTATIRKTFTTADRAAFTDSVAASTT